MASITDNNQTLTDGEGGLVAALSGNLNDQLEQQTLPQFLPLQRWFGAKDSTIESVTLTPLSALADQNHVLVLADIAIEGEIQRYFLPLSSLKGDLPPAKALYKLAKIGSGTLIDGVHDEDLIEDLLMGMRSDTTLPACNGTVVFSSGASFKSLTDDTSAFGRPRPLGVEQSNVSISYGNKIIFKLYRRLRPGQQPDVEVPRFLTQTAGFESTPQYLGAIEYRPETGEATTLAAAFAYVANKGDAWGVIVDALEQDLEKSALSSTSDGVSNLEFSPELQLGALLGRRTGELHKALSTPTDEADFQVNPLTTAQVKIWSDEAVREAKTQLDRLAQARPQLPAHTQSIIDEVLSKRDTLMARLTAATTLPPSGGQSRIHGDYHLGQLLVTDDDVTILDFEGEPRRELAERRAKSSPLRDVAGMLRSFHYAAVTALNRRQQATGAPSADTEKRAVLWRKTVTDDFLSAYSAAIAGSANYPSDKAFAAALTDLFILQKAIYEIGYELANRPDWVDIPLDGVRELLGRETL